MQAPARRSCARVPVASSRALSGVVSVALCGALAGLLAWAVPVESLHAQPVPGAAAIAEPMHLHPAQRGDTLIGLGRRFLVDPSGWPELARLNGIRNPRRIPIGSTLRIPLRLMHVEPAPAGVTAAHGDVRSGQRPVTAGQTLPEGSELVTGNNGHVTVRLVDGTILRLRSRGQVRIDESSRVPAAGAVRSGVKLDRGRVEIEAQPARGGQPGFHIGTPQGVLGVRGTEFRVEADDTQTRGEVLEGVVAFSGAVPGVGVDTPVGPASARSRVPAKPERRVAAGFGSVIDAGGRVAEPRPLLAAPDLSGLPALHERPLVRLMLPPQPGAQAWRVQVARDESFDDLLADVRSATPELRVAGLPDGQFPMRLRAVDEQGLEGRDARATLVLKARPEPPLPRAPAPGSIIRGTKVGLAWAASDEAARYRLQLARRDAPGKPFSAPLHDIKDIDELAREIDGLPPGLYEWRLASVRADGDQGPFGDALGFEMRALPPQPLPPAPPKVGEQSIQFYWQGLPGQAFDFQVARDDSFEQLVTQQTLDRTEIELPLPGSGRFYVRLRARDADGFVGPWSASQHFDVIPCVRDARNACVRVEGGTLQLQ
jgi:hypothetical protein